MKLWRYIVMLLVASVVCFLWYYSANYLHPDAAIPVRIKPIPWEQWGDNIVTGIYFLGGVVAALLIIELIGQLNDAFWLTKGGSLRYRVKRAFNVVWLRAQCWFFAMMYRFYSNKVENYLVSDGKGRAGHYHAIAELVKKRGYYYDKYWVCKSKL